MKRFTSFMLAIVMVCSLIMPASASGGGATGPAQVNIRAAGISFFGAPVEYVVSISGAKSVMNIRVFFEVDGAMLSGLGLEMLCSQFTAMETNDGIIRWLQKDGDIWQGEVMLLYLGGGAAGFDSAAELDLFKLIFDVKKTGGATVRLTDVQLTGGLEQDPNGIFLDGEIGNSEATTVISALYSVYDLNKDGMIDERDLAMAQRYYQVKEGDANWNAAQACDFNGDGVVDMLDLIDLFQHFATVATVPPTMGTITMGDLPAMRVEAGERDSVAVTAIAGNGQAIAIAAVSDAPGVATVAVKGKTITVAAIAAGTTTIRVTAAAAYCTSVVKSFVVTVPGADPDPAEGFVLFDGAQVPAIYVDAGDYKQIVRAADDLRDDINRVTTKTPEVVNAIEALGEKAIIVGSVDSPIIQDMMAAGKLDEATDLIGKWESYLIKLVDSPIGAVQQAIVIVGSDKRGGAYGIYDLSEQIGVSPWYYWGDIEPQVQDEIIIDTLLKVQGEPSVKYRGIFINDEQNLAYWAAKTEEKILMPGSNIGPDTYAKVFELLLRLKANYLWPGMHSENRLGPDANSTKQLGAIDHFNKYPENRELADLYGIVVGTSHCEPMMRNGTAEYLPFIQSKGYLPGFNIATYTGKVDDLNNRTDIGMLKYDYSIIENRPVIDEYWEESVKAYKNSEVSYTLGMRGLHDAGFFHQNASSTDAQTALLQEVVDRQIQMMEDNQVNEEAFPIFIPYKEVLPLYENGLVLPEETIIVWAEDNHGYIRRFPTADELDKYAGSGVYYHLNYEGTGSYSWLNSVSPNLMLSELRKAYESGAQALWVLNVGDIKPSEISIDLFTEMAWDIDRWDESNLDGTEQEAGFYELLAEKWFPAADSLQVAGLVEGYFHLVSILKPDHTTGSTGGNRLGFSAVNYDDELMQRVAELQELAQCAQAIYDALYEIDRAQADAFYQHVAYSIVGTYYNNLKYYHAQKNALYLNQGRLAAANLHAALVDWAHTQEDLATDYYNTGISGGKWNGIMQPHNGNNLRADRSPRPSRSMSSNIPYMSKLGVVAEGEEKITENSALHFSAYLEDSHFIDLFNMGSKGFAYEAEADKAWVTVSEPVGVVYDDLRLFVAIDWANLPAGDQTATLTVTGAGESRQIRIQVSNPATPRTAIDGYAEANGYVAIEAEHYTANQTRGDVGFFVFEGLGRSGAAVSAGPMGSASYYGNLASAPYLTYQVYFQTAGTFSTTVYRIPTLETSGQRFAIGVDGGTPSVISGQSIAESGSWSRNVINGIEKCTTTVVIPSAGYHTIRLYMVDAGVAIDRIVINTGGEADSNQGPPESYHSVHNPTPATEPRLLSMHQEYLDAYIAGTVEPLIAALAAEVASGTYTYQAEALAAVRDALNEVTQAPLPAGGDAVRRAYGKLMSAVASVDAMKNIDALLAQAMSKGHGIIQNGAGGISVYDQSAVDAFEAVYNMVAAALEGELTLTQKLDYYAQLMVAMNTVESTRMMTITASSFETANIPAYAIDSNPSTRWAASSGSDPQWVQVDLGGVYILDQIAITWYNNGSEVTNGTRRYYYTVSAGADTDSFTQVVDRTGNTQSNTVTDSMNQAVGRYVKIDVIGKNGGSASIFEIVITGTKPMSAGEEALELLRDALAKAALADKDTCTIDSYDNLLKQVAVGEALLADENPSEELVRQTADNVKAAYAALKARAIVINDTFDELNAIDDLGSDWVLAQTGGTVYLEEGEGENKYLKIEQERGKDGGNVVSASRAFEPMSGKVYIEAKVRSDTPQYFFGAPYIYDSAASGLGGDQCLASVALRAQTNNLSAQDIVTTYQPGSSATKTIGQFTSGQWHTVTMVLDTADKSVQVYLDGVRKDDGTHKFRASKDTIGLLRFYADDGTASRPNTTGYLDYVLVYTEGELVNPPEADIEQQIAQARTALESAISEAKVLVADDYTVDSYSALRTAVAAGEAELLKQEHLLADLNDCIAALAGAVDGLVERSYLVNDSFDQAESLEALKGEGGWTFVETGGNVTLEEGEDGNRYLRLERTARTSGTSVDAKRSFAGVSGKIYVEAKVRSDVTNGMFAAPFLYASYADSPQTSNVLGAVFLRESANEIRTTYLGNNSTSTIKVGNYTVGEWNTVCLIVDTTNYTMQVYVNGERKDNGTYVMRNNLDVLGMLRFYSDDTNTGRPFTIGCVDDVRVYQEKITP